MSFNPYEVLQVDRDADEATIRAAFRRLSRTLHPDAGGSTSEFARLSESRDILLDAERRRHFDRSGSTEQSSVDQVSAMAREFIIQSIHQITNSFVDHAAAIDPRTRDIVGDIKRSILKQGADIRQQLEIGRSHLSFLEDMRKRFRRKKKATGENFVDLMLSAEIVRIKGQIEKAEDTVKACDRAIEIMADFDFEVASSTAQSYPSMGVFFS